MAVKQRPSPSITSSSSSYNKPKRTQAMQEIRRLLVVEGYTYDEIIQPLNIAPRTFYRYLSVVFADDRRLLAENISDEEALNQIAIYRDRLLRQRRDILEQISNSPDADFKSRVAAHHLAGEIAAVVQKLYIEGPAILASRHRFPRMSLTAAESTTGLAMKLSSSSSSSLPSYTIKEQEEEEIYGDEEDEEVE